MITIEEFNLKSKGVSDTDAKCINSLKIRPREWNWLTKEDNGNVEKEISYAIHALETTDNHDLKLQFLLLLSQFANENTPWSNSFLATKVKAIKAITVQQLLPEFIRSLRGKFLNASTKTTNERTPRAARNQGLRPSLGFSAQTSEVDKARKNWKMSVDLFSLGSVCFWMHFDSEPESVSVMAAFALNIIDDSDPSYRTQGCYLIQKLLRYGHYSILQKLGLASLFKKELETCLNFLPRLTPGNVSLALMEVAYPCLVQIIDEEMKLSESQELPRKYLPYLEVLDKNTFGLISHIQGHKDGPSNLILVFLLRFGAQLISTKIKTAVLACFSRLNSMTCRLITDPFVIDSENGILVVEGALDLQRLVIEVVMEVENGPASLLLEYKYDLLACWTVFLKRVVRYGVGGERSHVLLKTNYQLLQSLAKEDTLTKHQFETAVQAIIEANPEIKEFYDYC